MNKATLLFSVLLLGLGGCSRADKAPSHDALELAKLVDLGIPVTNPRWERFSIPEGDFPPGPTDFVGLVAEFDLDRHTAAFLKGLPPAGLMSTYPHAARPWLSARHRAIFTQDRDSAVDYRRQQGCRHFRARVTSSSRPLAGFICPTAHSALVYLELFVSPDAGGDS